MAVSTQLCRDCHQITERTTDGDRVACSVCGRPYLVSAPSPPGAADRRPSEPRPRE